MSRDSSKGDSLNRDSLNREALANWLAEAGTTWRWNQGETGSYDAVELRSGRLRWYRWSHEMQDGGAQGEVFQLVAHFLSHGPPWPVPEAVSAAVRAKVEAP